MAKPLTEREKDRERKRERELRGRKREGERGWRRGGSIKKERRANFSQNCFYVFYIQKGFRQIFR